MEEMWMFSGMTQWKTAFSLECSWAKFRNSFWSLWIVSNSIGWLVKVANHNLESLIVVHCRKKLQNKLRNFATNIPNLQINIQVYSRKANWNREWKLDCFCNIVLFFIKIRESSLPVNVLREREQKWIKMLRNWDTWMTKKSPKVPVSNAQQFNVNT
jgi:hypothetical protein